MNYRVFNNQEELDNANLNWINASGGLNPDNVTKCWDTGILTNDGRIACQIPTKFADVFGGQELELTEFDFIMEQ